MKIYKYDDDMHQNDIIQSFNGIINHIYEGMDAYYH